MVAHVTLIESDAEVMFCAQGCRRVATELVDVLPRVAFWLCRSCADEARAVVPAAGGAM